MQSRETIYSFFFILYMEVYANLVQEVVNQMFFCHSERAFERGRIPT